MAHEAPPRLKDSAELGPILRAAAAPAGVPPERLAANGAAVKAAIAAGVRTGIPLWKVGLPVLLIAGAVIVQRLAAGDEPVPGSAVATGAPDAAPVIEPVAPSDAAVEVVVPAPDAPAGSDAPDAAAAPRPTRHRRVEVPPPLDAAPAPPPSDLPAQIQLYEEARAASARGDHAGGLDRLAELLRRYPATPLRADAELTRAELLARADRLDDAAAALEELAASASHRGRRGELLRTLGEIHRRRGDCPHAIDAYTRARAAGLSAGERSKVDRGLERCAAP